MTRYFFLYDDERIATVFRAKIDDQSQTFLEERWSEGQWVPSEFGRIFEHLTMGSTDVVEVTQDQVVKTFPDSVREKS